MEDLKREEVNLDKVYLLLSYRIKSFRVNHSISWNDLNKDLITKSEFIII